MLALRSIPVSRAGGFTVLEGLLACVIAAAACLGLLQAFAYGRLYVEKCALRRLALDRLGRELEYWRGAFAGAAAAAPLDPSLAASRSRRIELDPGRGLRARVESALHPQARYRGLYAYQDVDVKVTWSDPSGQLADTVSASARFYER